MFLKSGYGVGNYGSVFYIYYNIKVMRGLGLRFGVLFFKRV